jgi:hypothetical protein
MDSDGFSGWTRTLSLGATSYFCPSIPLLPQIAQYIAILFLRTPFFDEALA